MVLYFVGAALVMTAVAGFFLIGIIRKSMKEEAALPKNPISGR